MVRYFDYQLASSIEEITMKEGQMVTVNCLNPHSFVTATRDSLFHEALKDSDFLLPDGEGICMTLKQLGGGRRVKKIAGDDLHRYLLNLVSKEGTAGCDGSKGRVYYMGSSKYVLDRIAERLKREYPTLLVRLHSPSFCEALSDEESQRIIQDIDSFKPDVLFVSMTAPKQEKWVYAMRHNTTEGLALNSPKVVASIGAVFDFYAGTVKRAPSWAVEMKLEWLVRLLKEPKRMWRRNLVSGPAFLQWVWQHRKEM